MTKANSALRPFMELGNDIVGHESNLRRSANQLVFSGAAFWRDKREDRGPIRRSDGHPTLSGLKAGVINKTESKLVEVESETPVLITNENLHRMKPQVGFVSIVISI